MATIPTVTAVTPKEPVFAIATCLRPHIISRQMPRRRQLQVTLALAAILLPVRVTAKDLAVVTHKANPTKVLALSELVKICKGTTRKWPDGREIIFIMQDPESPEMKLVVQKIYGMSPEQVKALIATANHGRRERPAIMVINSDEALVKAVETTPGAVGVVDVYSITGGINVLKIDGKVPLEPGYLLHGN